ncbi:MAG: DUF3078 domain-containing protein [Chitinophagales bacterium]
MKTYIIHTILVFSFLLSSPFCFAQETEEDIIEESVENEEENSSPFNFHHEIFLAGHFFTFVDWQEGGNGNLTLVANYKAILEYKAKRFEMSHEFFTEYGYQKFQEKYFIKHADDFYLDSKYDFHHSENGAVSISTFFQSQYAPTFDMVEDSTGNFQKEFRSSFLTPAYITLSLGWAYKPTDWLRLNFGLASGQFTYIREKGKQQLISDSETLFGVSELKNTKWQSGFNFEFDFNQEIGKNLFWENRSNVFMNYTDLQVNLNIINRFNFKINKFMKLGLNTDLVFAPAITHKLQLKNEMLLGVFF